MKKLLLSLFAVLTASFATAQTNLLTNGGFEEWADGLPKGWVNNTVGSNTAGSLVALEQSTAAFSGTYAVAMTNTTADKTGSGQKNGRIASSEIKLKAGTYTFTIYMRAGDEEGAASRIGYTKIDTSTGKPGAYIYANNANGYDKPDTLTNEWAKKKIEFKLDAAATVCLVVMHSKNMIDKTVLLDDASLTTTDGGIDDGTEPDPQPQNDTFESKLTDSQGNWTIVDVTMPDGLTYIWSQSTSYGMKASAYKGGALASESYLVSPAIVLQEGSVLTFDHVQRYAANTAEELTLWIRENGATEWAAQLTIPTYSDGSNWTFVSSGNIDLSAYNGKTVQLGFRYVSTTSAAATWEIKNVKVTNAKAAEDAPELKDPSNTPETAYTIAQAIELINNRNGYDMSKEVYVKGIISAIKSLDVEQYERAQYWIVDQIGGDSIQVYNGYYVGKVRFSSNDQIKVGDNVVVCGKLTLYGSTYEIDQNNYMYSHNGSTVGIRNIATEQKNETIFDLAGRRVAKAQKGIYIVNGKKIVF